MLGMIIDSFKLITGSFTKYFLLMICSDALGFMNHWLVFFIFFYFDIMYNSITQGGNNEFETLFLFHKFVKLGAFLIKKKILK